MAVSRSVSLCARQSRCFTGKIAFFKDQRHRILAVTSHKCRAENTVPLHQGLPAGGKGLRFQIARDAQMHLFEIQAFSGVV